MSTGSEISISFSQIEGDSDSSSASSIMTLNTFDEDEQDESYAMHDYVLCINTTTIEWYTEMKRKKVIFQFINPMDNSGVIMKEGHSLYIPNLLLLDTLGQLNYSALPSFLLDMLIRYPPHVIVSDALDGKLLLMGVFQFNRLNVDFMTTYLRSRTYLTTKNRDILGKMSFLIKIVDLKQSLTGQGKSSFMTKEMSKFHASIKHDIKSLVSVHKKMGSICKHMSQTIKNIEKSMKKDKTYSSLESVLKTNVSTTKLSSYIKKSPAKSVCDQCEENQKTIQTPPKYIEKNRENVSSLPAAEHTDLKVKGASAECIFLNPISKYTSDSTTQTIIKKKLNEDQDTSNSTQQILQDITFDTSFESINDKQKIPSKEKFILDRFLSEIKEKFQIATEETCGYSDRHVSKANVHLDSKKAAISVLEHDSDDKQITPKPEMQHSRTHVSGDNKLDFTKVSGSVESLSSYLRSMYINPSKSEDAKHNTGAIKKPVARQLKFLEDADFKQFLKPYVFKDINNKEQGATHDSNNKQVVPELAKPLPSSPGSVSRPCIRQDNNEAAMGSIDWFQNKSHFEQHTPKSGSQILTTFGSLLNLQNNVYYKSKHSSKQQASIQTESDIIAYIQEDTKSTSSPLQKSLNQNVDTISKKSSDVSESKKVNTVPKKCYSRVSISSPIPLYSPESKQDTIKSAKHPTQDCFSIPKSSPGLENKQSVSKLLENFFKQSSDQQKAGQPKLPEQKCRKSVKVQTPSKRKLFQTADIFEPSIAVVKRLCSKCQKYVDIGFEKNVWQHEELAFSCNDCSIKKYQRNINKIAKYYTVEIKSKAKFEIPENKYLKHLSFNDMENRYRELKALQNKLLLLFYNAKLGRDIFLDQYNQVIREIIQLEQVVVGNRRIEEQEASMMDSSSITIDQKSSA